MKLTSDQAAQLLGSPLTENEVIKRLMRDYPSHEQTMRSVLIRKISRFSRIQMFFCLSDEATAFNRMGFLRRIRPPTMHNGHLKRLENFGPFSKVRLSLNEGQVIAMIVEP